MNFRLLQSQTVTDSAHTEPSVSGTVQPSETGHEPLISVIIPTFNRLDRVHQLLDSLPTRKSIDYEVIVVDDASDEDLTNVSNRCDQFIRNPGNLGPAYSRNVAAMRSRGQILLFLDSDVVLLPGSLKKLPKIFQQSTDIGAVGGSGPPNERGDDVLYVRGKSYDRLGRTITTTYSPNDVKDDSVFDCHHLESAFLAIRREVFEKVGGFDPYWFYMGEDRDLCLRIKDAGFRVVVSVATRAIHHHLHSETKDFERFLLTRYLQVALKLGGTVGGLLWMFGNWDNRLLQDSVFDLVAEFKHVRKLTRRRNSNFVSTRALDTYARAQLRDSVPFEIPDSVGTPNSLVVFVIDRCNQTCDHCFLNTLNSGTPEMEASSLYRMINSLRRPASVSLTGGEGFLRRDFSEILAYLMDHPSVTSLKILTNGSTPEHIEKLCRGALHTNGHKPLEIQVSLDGLRETHNAIRHSDRAFDKALETCERARRLQSEFPFFSFVLAITIMQSNLHEIENLVDLLENKGLKSKLSIVRSNSLTTFDVPEAILDAEYEPTEHGLVPQVGDLRLLFERIEGSHPRYFEGSQRAKLEDNARHARRAAAPGTLLRWLR